MTLSVQDFLSRLEDSAVLDTDEVHALLTDLPPEKRPQDAEQLAKELVRRKLLTSYQAQAIYQNKHKGLVLGNYVILDRLGQGGMGLVLKAEHKRMHRLVALKVLSPAATKSRDAVKRFHREVEAAAKLDHPNICTAFDADEAGGVNFLVMQYVDGSDLSVVVKSKGPMTVEKALHCIVEAARGLEYAHSRGVIHRDVKPSNLLLDRDGHVKILDMGLARIDAGGDGQGELTQTGEVMGTVDYMAPEQALNTKLADARCDIYSLGYTLWYLLVGKAAYPGDSLMAKLLAHRDQPEPSLLQARPDVSEEVDAVFRRMVAKQPSERFQTMTEVLSALEECRNGSTAPSLQVQRSEDSRLVSFLNSEQPARSTAAGAVKTKGGSSVDQPILVFAPPDAGSAKRRTGAAKRRGKWKPPEWLSDPRVIAGLTAAGVFAATLVVLAIISRAGRPSNSGEPAPRLQAKPLLKPRKADAAKPGDGDQDASADIGWTPLFNGRNLDGWEPVSNAAEWKVDNGVLVGRGQPGWLASNAQFENLELTLDYRLDQGGNSGVFLRAWPDGGATGARFLEIQLLDDKAYASTAIKPETRTGALFDIAAPTETLDTTPEKWHALRVKLVGDRLEVQHDGRKCLDFDLSGSISNKEALSRKTGQIGLQSFSQSSCRFRDIKVRRLDSRGKPVAAAQTARPGWVDLFDGQSLQGWVQRGGNAKFRAESGEIIGTSVPDTPNSFLCTMGGYRDFELELEFKVEAPLNSGVQIRSQYAETDKTVDLNGVQKNIRGNTVYGYQVEIDPVNRWSTGGIYEEGGRGWLSNPSNNAGEAAFKPGQWNRLHVECLGNRIRTRLNGTVAVEVPDSASFQGFIALQVHSVPRGQPPLEVRFRNIQVKRL